MFGWLRTWRRTRSTPVVIVEPLEVRLEALRKEIEGIRKLWGLDQRDHVEVIRQLGEVIRLEQAILRTLQDIRNTLETRSLTTPPPMPPQPATVP